MSSHKELDMIIARLEKIESKLKKVDTLLKLHEQLYKEVKLLRNNYKNHNKLVAAFRDNIPKKLDTIKAIFLDEMEFN